MWPYQNHLSPKSLLHFTYLVVDVSNQTKSFEFQMVPQFDCPVFGSPLFLSLVKKPQVLIVPAVWVEVLSHWWFHHHCLSQLRNQKWVWLLSHWKQTPSSGTEDRCVCSWEAWKGKQEWSGSSTAPGDLQLWVKNGFGGVVKIGTTVGILITD